MFVPCVMMGDDVARHERSPLHPPTHPVVFSGHLPLPRTSVNEGRRGSLGSGVVGGLLHFQVTHNYTYVRQRGRPSKRTLGPKRTTLQGKSPSKRTLKFSPEIFYIRLKWSPKHPTSVFRDHYRFFCCDSYGPGYDVC